MSDLTDRAAQSEPTMIDKSHIGMLFRERRLADRLTLTDVGARLRIRPAFLEAIETADYKNLPGIAYAVGFVRSYATMLGMDGAAAVQRFKLEAVEMARRPALTFPTIAAQGRGPGPISLAIALTACAVVAIGWYLWVRGPEIVTPRIPEVPARLTSQPPAETASPPSQSLPQSSIEANSPPPPVSITPPSAPSSAPSSAPPAAPLAAPAPSSLAQGSALAPRPAPTPAATAPINTSTQPAPTGFSPGVSALTAAPITQTSADGRVTHSYGTQDPSVRVTLTAREESWVQIKDGDQMVVTRLLEPGDSVRVPNKPGLTLQTGNAKGIDFAVDGAVVPPLSTHKEIIRNLSLDPDDLKKGKRPKPILAPISSPGGSSAPFTPASPSTPASPPQPRPQP